jgi:hypothetical protein
MRGAERREQRLDMQKGERIVSGPTVDMSMSHCPGLSAPATPSSAKSTCSSAGGFASIVITASAPARVSAGDTAAVAPWSTSGRTLALVRFQTVS